MDTGITTDVASRDEMGCIGRTYLLVLVISSIWASTAHARLVLTLEQTCQCVPATPSRWVKLTILVVRCAGRDQSSRKAASPVDRNFTMLGFPGTSLGR